MGRWNECPPSLIGGGVAFLEVLRFLHISDIHFTTILDEAREVDIETEVRDRMLVDFARMRERCGQFDGVLLVGDIAARGQEAEYHDAARFLSSATEIVGCPSDQVICVPGNHDIDRHMQVPAHRHVRSDLRRIPTEEISDALVHLVRDPLSSALIFRPLTEYNKFALAYDCDIGPTRPMWPPKTFQLGARVVQVHGLTSCWIADASDSPEPQHQLVCGEFQGVPIGSDPSHISVTLCHHPDNWLRDGELVKPWRAQASIVLTGHEHVAGLQLSDDQRTLYLASGAVNPERTQKGWIPAYNVIELELPEDSHVELAAVVYVRTWQGAQGHAEFGPSPDCDDPVSLRIRLGPSGTRPERADAPDELVPELPPEPMTSAKHSQVHTIMLASPDDRQRVARDLGLEVGADVVGLEYDRAILRLALDRGQLAELAALLVQGADDV